MEIYWTICCLLTVCLMETLIVTEVNGEDFLERVCLKPSDKGQDCGVEGKKPQTVYAFSKEKEECVEFEYLGCGGNENRFEDQNECTDSCQIDYFKKKNKKAKKKKYSSESAED